MSNKAADDKKTYVYDKSKPLEGISQTVFTIANRVILPAWILLAFAPEWEFTESLIHGAVLINCNDSDIPHQQPQHGTTHTHQAHIKRIRTSIAHKRNMKQHDKSFGVYMLGLCYAFAILTSWGWNPADTGFGTFRQVINLMRTSHDRTLLGAWIHYLAFDILVAQQCVKDAKQLSLPHLYVAPILFFILMFGPIGFLMYVIERQVFLWMTK